MQDFMTRFWSKAEPLPSGCWLWTGALQRETGYGRFAYKHGVTGYAHRIAVELTLRREIPANREVDHLCRNRWCVNPEHLEVVTAAVNTRRILGGRASRTHCPQGHEYAGANLLINVDHCGRKHRACRACRDARNARRARL